MRAYHDPMRCVPPPIEINAAAYCVYWSAMRLSSYSVLRPLPLYALPCVRCEDALRPCLGVGAILFVLVLVL